MAFEGMAGLLGKLGGHDIARKASSKLEQAANDFADDARANVPVDTGALSDSIRVVKDSPDKYVVIAGETNQVPYAAHVEYGTSRMGAQPFMRPAASDAEGQWEQTMGQALDEVEKGLGR